MSNQGDVALVSNIREEIRLLEASIKDMKKAVKRMRAIAYTVPPVTCERWTQLYIGSACPPTSISVVPE